MNSFYINYCKRAFDLITAIVLLVLSLWLLLLIVILYYLSLQGSPFFIQRRIGKNNDVFLLYKFRTLSDDVNKSLQERTFKLGKFLRLTNLDELPQLVNIVKGDLSFIGPRPLPIEYLHLFSKEQLRRHEVRPGITGWAQVNGRHSIPWKQKFILDLYYVNNISLRLDMLIAIKTIALILSFKKDVSLMEEKFDGNA